MKRLQKYKVLIWFGIAFGMSGCYLQNHPVILLPNQILVRPGDTLSGLAHKHGIRTRELARANQLTPPYHIFPGHVLFLPGPKNLEKKHSVSRAPIVPVQRVNQSLVKGPESSNSFMGKVAAKKNSESRELIQSFKKEIAQELAQEEIATLPGKAQKIPEKSLTNPAASSEKTGLFMWPLKGVLLKGYSTGPVRSDGLIIGVAGGTPVKAAEKGQVIYVGRDVPDMGNLILVRHRSGWVSAYGHVENQVKVGQLVERGQVLGKVEKKLHKTKFYFEIRKEGAKPVNPLLYLSP